MSTSVDKWTFSEKSYDTFCQIPIFQNGMFHSALISEKNCTVYLNQRPNSTTDFERTGFKKTTKTLLQHMRIGVFVQPLGTYIIFLHYFSIFSSLCDVVRFQIFRIECSVPKGVPDFILVLIESSKFVQQCCRYVALCI